MDHVPKTKRSAIMRAVRSKDTGPELILRRALHSEGYRYRLHASNLPGKPDIVFPSRKVVIFVNGCFWHGHAGCRKGRLPKTRIAYWRRKIELNRARDAARIRQLRALGWGSLVVWQCQLANHERTLRRVRTFLEE